eukprot:3913070-Lingulodinium_polyedra.AAC.1
MLAQQGGATGGTRPSRNQQASGRPAVLVAQSAQHCAQPGLPAKPMGTPQCCGKSSPGASGGSSGG